MNRITRPLSADADEDREDAELTGRPVPAASWQGLERGGVLPEQATPAG